MREVGKAERAPAAPGEALDSVRLGDYGDRASRPSCPAASASASRWPARWSTGRKVLLLDEPLGALDLKLREQMQVELKEIQRQVGITFVFVTHDQEEALTMSDRIAVFNRGRIEQVGVAGRGLRAAGHARSSPASSAPPTCSAAPRPSRCWAAPGVWSVRPEKIRIGARRRASPRPTSTRPPAPCARSCTSARRPASSSTSTPAATLVALQQNLQTSSMDVQRCAAPRVQLIWKKEHEFEVAAQP